jgi:hypothetical protein
LHPTKKRKSGGELAMARCLSCGAENPATNRFCGQCGIKLERANAAAANSANDAGRSTTNDAGRSNSMESSPAVGGDTSPSDPPPSKYNIVIVAPNTARSGFLGLSDDGTPGYDDEEPEKPSHLGRNIAGSVVAVALLLGAWQWRSIRDYVVRQYSVATDSGKPPNPSAVATETAPGLPPAAAETRAPKVGEGSGADRAHAVQPSGNSGESAASAANSNASPGSLSPHAMGAPVAESPSPYVSSRRAKLRTAPAADFSSTALAGADEMNRAAHTDGEARAAWLWKAVGKGNPRASVELARMYVQGSGVVRNCDQAQILLRGAAEKGNEQAKFSLQQMRLQGGCTPRR